MTLWPGLGKPYMGLVPNYLVAFIEAFVCYIYDTGWGTLGLGLLLRVKKKIFFFRKNDTFWHFLTIGPALGEPNMGLVPNY